MGPALNLSSATPGLKINSQPGLQINSTGSGGFGGLAAPKPVSPAVPTFDPQMQALINSNLQQAALMRQQLALHPLAPTLDLASINNQARAQAEQNVNPLYTQKLNEYLQNTAAETAAQKAKNEADVKNLQAQLANSLQGNQLQGEATQQNTEAALGNINAQEQNYQAQSGTAFEAQRSKEATQAGASGLAGSGLAQGQAAAAEQARGATEGAQETQYQYGRQQKQLFETQTLGQLANSADLAKLKEQSGENTSNFDLNSYLRQAAYGQQQFTEQNEQERQAAILAQQQQQSGNLISQFISSFKSNPALYNAALQAYGGLTR